MRAKGAQWGRMNESTNLATDYAEGHVPGQTMGQVVDKESDSFRHVLDECS